MDLPSGRTLPSGEEGLREYVAWLRGLGHDELLRLSNAEFDFEESELVEWLEALRGEWVVPVLGDLAMVEADPLLKAILVQGLLGMLDLERGDDPRMLPILETLLGQMGRKEADPFQRAYLLASFTYMACLRNGHDYAARMAGHLLGSDNPQLLTHGYLFMGMLPGGEETLKLALSAHPSSSGRLGALEGLRGSALKGRVPPAELTALGLAALESETDEGNRLLLYEMLVSAGGEDGLSAVEGMLRSGQVSEIDQTVELLALKMEPERARALFQDLLRDHVLEGETKQAMYRALGLLAGDQELDYLLEVARDGALEESERLAGLRGLWNRPVDERMAAELRSVFDSAEDESLRIEALRMLVHGESEGAGLDLRALGVLDESPAVRAEAIQLASVQPSDDTREWLEERLLEDPSMDVKAAALGALVLQAHYTGGGDKVLGYLERARERTGDEGSLAMIAEGERMVKDHDDRNLELGLAEEAHFWGTVARHADGPAARDFQLRARRLEQIVSSLRRTRDTRRDAR